MIRTMMKVLRPTEWTATCNEMLHSNGHITHRIVAGPASSSPLTHLLEGRRDILYTHHQSAYFLL